MKNFLLGSIAAAGLALCASPASATDYGLTVRHLNFDGGGDANQFAITGETGIGPLRTGALFENTQGDRGQTNLAAVNAGVNLAAPLGLTLKPRLELGYQHTNDIPAPCPWEPRGSDSHGFWGASVGVERHLIGPVNAEASYRYRNGFESGYRSDRFSLGVNAPIGPRMTVNADWYNDASSGYTGVGVGLVAHL